MIDLNNLEKKIYALGIKNDIFNKANLDEGTIDKFINDINNELIEYNEKIIDFDYNGDYLLLKSDSTFSIFLEGTTLEVTI